MELRQLITTAREFGLLRTHKVRGKEFAFTGTLSVKRDEIKAIIGLLGGFSSDSVRSSTDYLLIPDASVARSSKLRAAQERGITIITETDFCLRIFPTLAELQE